MPGRRPTLAQASARPGQLHVMRCKSRCVRIGRVDDVCDHGARLLPGGSWPSCARCGRPAWWCWFAPQRRREGEGTHAQNSLLPDSWGDALGALHTTILSQSTDAVHKHIFARIRHACAGHSPEHHRHRHDEHPPPCAQLEPIGAQPRQSRRQCQAENKNAAMPRRCRRGAPPLWLLTACSGIVRIPAGLGPGSPRSCRACPRPPPRAAPGANDHTIHGMEHIPPESRHPHPPENPWAVSGICLGTPCTTRYVARRSCCRRRAFRCHSWSSTAQNT